MKFILFLEEKIFFILFQTSFIFIVIGILYLVNMPLYYIAITTLLLILLIVLYLFIEYLFTIKKYKKIISLVDDLEEKYLIADILKKPFQLENKAYYYALKHSCKAMNDKIGQLEKDFLEYREYIENFVHEIKTPIAALSLTFDNNKDFVLKSEIDKINEFVEQMLFYARSNYTEKDYFVTELQLEEVVHNVLLKYRRYILNEKIQLNIHHLNNKIYTDEKWIVFILSQIIQNCIKYLDKSNKKIEIFSQNNKNNVILTIKDNGCGIDESDLDRIYEKGFTGMDRKKKYSTGMGLYLSNKLCEKLGLNLKINSIKGQYTEVHILFPKNSIYHNLASSDT